MILIENCFFITIHCCTIEGDQVRSFHCCFYRPLDSEPVDGAEIVGTLQRTMQRLADPNRGREQFLDNMLTAVAMTSELESVMNYYTFTRA